MELDVWSDIACPWCYVGKRRLDAALKAYGDSESVTVRWRSFELDPNAPATPRGTAPERLGAKYGITPEQAAERMRELERMAAGDGLELDLANATGGNTFDGHRLLHLAREHDLEGALLERLMRAYHAERAAIADHATLRTLAVEVGLTGTEVDDVLGSERFADAVREDELLAQQLQVRGVPCFVADRRYAVSGAQPPEVLADFLRQSAAPGADERTAARQG